MIELTPTQRRALRAAAHHLNPVASLGQQGLTPAVLKEINNALNAHELIKVKLHGVERADREALQSEICQQLQCAPVQHIGNILVLWREKPEEPVSTAPKAAPVRRSTPAKPRTKKQIAEKSDARRSRR